MSVEQSSQSNSWAKRITAALVRESREYRRVILIVGVYVTISALWIYTSDSVLVLLPITRKQMEVISIFKGMLFVLVTGLLLYSLIRRLVAELQRANRAEQEGRKIMSQIVNSVPHAIFWKDKMSVYLGCNQVFAHTLGLQDPAVVVGKTDYNLPGLQQANRLQDRDREAMESGSHKLRNTEIFQRPGGPRLWLDVTKVPLRDQEENVIGVLGVFEDITARRQQEQILRESEERFRRIFEESPLGITMSNFDFHFIKANRAFCRMIGYSEEELLSLSFKEITHPDHLADNVESVLRVRDDQQGSVYRTEKRYIRKNGKVLWGSVTLVAVRDTEGNFLYFLAMVEDITQRKLAEENLKRSREQLRALSSRLESLREEERTRLAREIHDHLGQLLTAIKLDLRSLERRISALDVTEFKQTLSDKIISVRALTDETINSVQKIASELRPGILDRLGLAAAIEAEVQQFQSRTGLHCQWQLPREKLQLPQTYTTAIYRILQEILTNIARHAQARNVTVDLLMEEEQLILEVVDDGIGINENDVEHPKSLGLVGMQERAAILGGKVVFGRKPGLTHGTVVTVRLPLKGKE